MKKMVEWHRVRDRKPPFRRAILVRLAGRLPAGIGRYLVVKHMSWGGYYAITGESLVYNAFGGDFLPVTHWASLK